MSINIKKQVIYDPGSAKFQEDELIYCPDKMIFGVLDGVSGLYTPKIGPAIYNGLSGAQNVAKIVSNVFSDAPNGIKLEGILKTANLSVRKFCLSKNLDLSHSESLPAVDFAVAQIISNKINIFSTGDCFAVWQKWNGTLGFTKNQGYKYDLTLEKKIKQMLKKYNDRDRAWRELLPWISSQRRILINNKGFAMLNGQDGLYTSWQHVVLELASIKYLVLFTDGMVLFSDTKHERLLAQKIIRLYKKGGLMSILNNTRKAEAQDREFSHSKFSEATAVALDFV